MLKLKAKSNLDAQQTFHSIFPIFFSYIRNCGLIRLYSYQFPIDISSLFCQFSGEMGNQYIQGV